jgi:hypothetical protein
VDDERACGDCHRVSTVRQRAGWRGKASAYYTYRDALVRLNISLLLIAADEDDVQIRKLTEDFLSESRNLGESLRKMNQLRDDPGSEASSPQPSTKMIAGSDNKPA